MLYNDFHQALAAGHVGEELVSKTLSASGYKVQDVTDNSEYFSKDIDLIADNDSQHLEIEVKADSRVAETGNVVIETMTNVRENKKGWFYYTQATHVFFVDVVNKIIHCVRMDELKKLYKKYSCRGIYHKTTRQWEMEQFYKEGEIALVPLSLLETTEHYVKINANNI